MELSKKAVYQEACISLDVDKASPRRIRKAVLELLRQPRYSPAFVGVMNLYRSSWNTITIANLNDRRAESRHPILGRHGEQVALDKSMYKPDFLYNGG